MHDEFMLLFSLEQAEWIYVQWLYVRAKVYLIKRRNYFFI